MAREAAEKAAREEAERLAREAAEKAAREEAERLAREAAEKAAREEAERLAREAAEKAAREEAERLAQEEAERLAREAAELAKQAEEQAPISSKKLISTDEYRPSEPIAELGEEQPAPESGEIASQRKPAGVPTPAELRFVVEPAPAPAPEPAFAASAPPLAIDVFADSVKRPAISADVAHFVGAVRERKPVTFGALLDLSLALGED